MITVPPGSAQSLQALFLNPVDRLLADEGPMSSRSLAIGLHSLGEDTSELLIRLYGRPDHYLQRQDGKWTLNSVVSRVPGGRLGIADGRGWRSLPSWGAYYVDLGRALSVASKTKHGRVTVGVAAPVRAYAAALIATGVVLGGAELSDANPARWFRQLSAMPIGTPMTIKTGLKLEKAVFDGVKKVDGGDQKYLALRSGRRDVRYMPESESLRVTPAVRRSGSTTKGWISLDEQFLKPLLKKTTPLDFVRKSHFHCLIVGSVNEFRAEVLDQSFATPSSGAARRGRLQSILRVARLIGRAGHYRSELIAAGDPIPHELGVPSVIIHNGAEASLKSYSSSYSARTIAVVMIGLSDRHAEEAVAMLSGAYSRRNGEAKLPEPPKETGIEMLAFRDEA